MSGNLEKQQWPQDWKRSVFISISKKGSTKEYANYWTFSLIYNVSKTVLKIFQAGLHYYMNQELPDVQNGFRKGRETRDQIENICLHEESQGIQERKKSHICFIGYAKIFDCVNHNKLCKTFKEMEIPDHLTVC